MNCYETGQCAALAEQVRRLKQADPFIRLAIIGAQLGEMQHCFVRAMSDPANADGYLAWAKTAMMDMLVQNAVFCELQGWDHDDLLNKALEKMSERLKEVAEAVKHE